MADEAHAWLQDVVETRKRRDEQRATHSSEHTQRLPAARAFFGAIRDALKKIVEAHNKIAGDPQIGWNEREFESVELVWPSRGADVRWALSYRQNRFPDPPQITCRYVWHDEFAILQTADEQSFLIEPSALGIMVVNGSDNAAVVAQTLIEPWLRNI
jgi:hypothetical protein